MNGPESTVCFLRQLDQIFTLQLTLFSFFYQGDLVHVRVLGQSILIINSFTVADELLEKRSLNTSDRYLNTMAMLYVMFFIRGLNMRLRNSRSGWRWALVFMSYGPEWRKHRRATHRAYYEAKSLDAFKPLLKLHTGNLLSRLLEDPHGWIDAGAQYGVFCIRFRHL